MRSSCKRTFARSFTRLNFHHHGGLGPPPWLWKLRGASFAALVAGEHAAVVPQPDVHDPVLHTLHPHRGRLHQVGHRRVCAHVPEGQMPIYASIWSWSCIVYETVLMLFFHPFHFEEKGQIIPKIQNCYCWWPLKLSIKGKFSTVIMQKLSWTFQNTFFTNKDLCIFIR